MLFIPYLDFDNDIRRMKINKIKKTTVINCRFVGDPSEIRTRVTAVKGRCPRPLDDGVIVSMYSFIFVFVFFCKHFLLFFYFFLYFYDFIMFFSYSQNILKYKKIIF